MCYADSKPSAGKATAGNNNQQMIDTAHREKNFSSPEETWKHFKIALLDGNYESAKDCYSASNRSKINELKKFGDAKTKEIIRQMKSLKKVHQEKDKAIYMIIRDMQGVAIITYVYFARINNEWKIEHY
jgi:hypothetical protein